MHLQLSVEQAAIRHLTADFVDREVAPHAVAWDRARWLPRLCSGAALGCFAPTEPDSGSDAAALTTRAVRDGADWLLIGRALTGVNVF
ncbi:hypothetical protein [Micromonospora deserti]|uniref:hypothetical protein n=1 Tax=Micromonospora deserti TaxID=2070366 RepID=UPI000DA9E806